MKPMAVVLMFSSAHDSLYNMCNFNWDHCLIRKWANAMKAYNISVLHPVLHWLWWYIDTLKVVEDIYLSIGFVRKECKYPDQIFVNISHGC